MSRRRRLMVLAAMAVVATAARLLVPAHAPMLRERFPVAAASALSWAEGVYVVDIRAAADRGWTRLDEHDWDRGLERILADGAFSARIVVVADAGDDPRLAQVIARLAHDLPLARVTALLGGSGAVPGGYCWTAAAR